MSNILHSLSNELNTDCKWTVYASADDYDLKNSWIDQ